MNQPLSTKRAKLFALDETELRRLLPEIDPDDGTMFFQAKNWKECFLQDLANKGQTIARGDIISMPLYGEDKDDTDKWVFDGQKIYEFEMQMDKGLLPEQFQVIREFPINYWQGVLDKPFVPYDFGKHHPQAELEDIEVVKVGSMTYFYYPVFGQDIKDKYKIICDVSTTRKNPVTAKEFLFALFKAGYFQTTPRNKLPDELQAANSHLYLPM
jgi:hypothetical protein